MLFSVTRTTTVLRRDPQISQTHVPSDEQHFCTTSDDGPSTNGTAGTVSNRAPNILRRSFEVGSPINPIPPWCSLCSRALRLYRTEASPRSVASWENTEQRRDRFCHEKTTACMPCHRP